MTGGDLLLITIHVTFLQLVNVPTVSQWDMGSSAETVAFQVYEILKINHKFLQFF